MPGLPVSASLIKFRKGVYSETINVQEKMLAVFNCSCPRSSRYERLGEVVEFLFPPIGKDVVASLACPEFSQFSYWKPPLPSVDVEDFV